LLAGLRKKNTSTDFHKIRRKGGTGKPLDCGGNLDHVTSGLAGLAEVCSLLMSAILIISGF